MNCKDENREKEVENGTFFRRINNKNNSGIQAFYVVDRVKHLQPTSLQSSVDNKLGRSRKHETIDI